MKRFNQFVMKGEQLIGTVLLIVVVVLVFVSAIIRITPNVRIIWSMDMSQLLFTWISMIGADIALKKKGHMGVDMLVRKFPEKLQKGLQLFSYLLCCAFSAFVTYWGITLCIENALRKYQTLGISYSFATAAVPVISIFMLLTLLEQIIDLIKNWKNPLNADDSPDNDIIDDQFGIFDETTAASKEA